MLIIFQYDQPSISYLRVYFYVTWTTFSKMPRACIVFNLIPVFFGKNARILHITCSISENPVWIRYRVILYVYTKLEGWILLPQLSPMSARVSNKDFFFFSLNYYIVLVSWATYTPRWWWVNSYVSLIVRTSNFSFFLSKHLTKMLKDIKNRWPVFLWAPP